jgi:NAD(P)-dependent dehydrogenase (short-subunit alcohol dehydrogenase family)
MTDGRLRGQVAVITGAASGIGAATARRFVAEGAKVLLADVQDDAGKALVAELGEDRTAYIHCDVSREEDIADAVDTAVARYGTLDVFYANAGVMGALGPIARTNTADADMTIAINLRGVLLSMKHAARVMQPRGRGVILATSSPAAEVGGVGPHTYSATKAGIIGLMQSVAAELRAFGIRVNAIVPGAIVSAMTADILTGDAGDLDKAHSLLAEAGQTTRPGLPTDIAAAAAFLASEDAAFATGSTFHIDGGYTRAPGDSPFASGGWAEPAGMFEGGRRSRQSPDH